MKESEKLYQTYQLKKLERLDFLESHFVISYVNVKSLRCHLKNVMKDSFLMASDVLSLGETWLDPGDCVSLDGFCESTFANHGRGKGLATFTKLPFSNEATVKVLDTLSLIKISFKEVDILSLYVSGNNDQAQLCTILEQLIDHERPTVVMGDMNINYLEKSALKGFMEEMGFSQLVQNSTFDSGSLIDHMYINQKMAQKNIVFKQHSVYYSDHDIISVLIRK